MKKNIKILYLEDDDMDFELVKIKLRENSQFSFVITRATDQATYEQLLEKKLFDIVLSDYSLQNYTGLDALKYLNHKHLSTAFILLSGAVDNALAVEIMKQGAFDCVLKNYLEKLPIVIERAMTFLCQIEEKMQWESMFHTIEKAALAGFFRLDLQGKYIYSNQYLSEILSSPPEQLLKQLWYSIFRGVTYREIKNTWKAEIEQKGIYRKLVHRTDMHGDKKWINFIVLPELHDQKLIGYIGVAFDVTSIKTTEQKLAFIKKYDAVTSFLNKKGFEDALKAYLKRHAKKNKQAMVLFSDIDNFKRLNDALGPLGGDDVLKAVALILTTHYGDDASIARWNNDTFAILFSHITKESEVIQLVQELNAYLAENPISIKNDAFFITLTTGIVSVLKTEKTAQEILQHADQALHYAKRHYKGKYCFYTEDISKTISRSAELEHAFYYGITHNEFYLVYQPQININTHQVIGFEALCRFNSSFLGEISAIEVIAFAEKTGFIVSLTKYLMKCFFYDLAHWLLNAPELFEGLQVSFNLSGKLIGDKDFFEFIVSQLKRYHLNPKTICFEITETAMMEDREKAKKFVNKLSALGFSLSVDDFGTGQSSLAYLQSLPVNTLKIDQSFMTNLEQDRSVRKIIRAIISLANILKLNVIAEGVESQSQAEILSTLKCSFVQGYYYSKPLQVNKVTPFILNFNRKGRNQ